MREETMRYFAWIPGLLFIMMPCALYADISGTVTDTNGDPVEGAFITLTNQSDPDEHYSVYTDETGSYLIVISPTGVDETPPLPFTLHQNYPNPFNPATTIPFTLDKAGHVTLAVYNITGQKICTLVDDYQSSGMHAVIWDGRDQDGHGAGAGLYLCQMKCNEKAETQKMLLIDGGNSFTGGGFRSIYSVQNAKALSPEESLYSLTVNKNGYQAYINHGVYLSTTVLLDVILNPLPDVYKISFASIPGGTFQMGDLVGDMWDDCRPVHTATVSSFEISKCEITNIQYTQYLNEARAENTITVTNEMVQGSVDPWNGRDYMYLPGNYSLYPDNDCKIVYSGDTFSVKTGYENWPVTWVTWYGARAFADHYGLELPREAEWEYACRWGDNQFKYSTDDGTINSKKVNYGMNVGHPVAVGSYPSNPYGIFDMSGNVWEWCNDWYSDFTSASVTDPTGPAVGSDRVIRGGGWQDDALICRSSGRGRGGPTGWFSHIGFRVSRRP